MGREAADRTRRNGTGRETRTGGTRQAILEAALELFSDRGFFGTGLRDIARSVGIRESGIYNHFPSKEALLDALLADCERESGERIPLDIGPEDDLREELIAFGDRLLERFSSERERRLFRVLLSDGLRLNGQGRINLLERIAASRRQMSTFMKRLSELGHLRDVEPVQAAIAFFAPIVMWRHLLELAPSTAPERRAYIRRHVDLFLDGVGARR